MRRSTVVQLTLIPMIAAAAVAAADPPTAAPADPPTAASGDPEPQLAPPGMAQPMLSPPGMTPSEDECQIDPANPRCDLTYFDNDVADCIVDPYDPDFDPDCQPAVAIVGGNVIRGGFGGYFWVAHS